MLMDAPIRLLLVDDDEVDRTSVRRSLHHSGLNYTLHESVDFSTAIDALTENAFDCVLLDLHLPGRSGVDIFNALPGIRSETTPAVIFLTGEENEKLALEVMASGAVDYLSKQEVTPSLLRRAIRYAAARQDFLQEISEIGRRDILTGLPNRSVFSDTLPGFIAQSARSRTIVATLLLDLDNFKDINDTMGHAAGDDILRSIANTLKESVRETDIVMRLGGDEFIVIAPNLKDEFGAANLAEKITAALSEPMRVGESELQVSASIGVALVPHDGASAEQILKCAELALYKAKEEERGDFCFFDRSLDEAAHCRQQVEREMQLALKRGEFELHYQPKIAVSDGTIVGAEALIRWNHPERGLVGPNEFIPIAEANRFIVPIGEWVLRTASAHLVSWRKAGLDLQNCSINLSPVQVSSARLLKAFNAVIDETGVDPACLEIEITESALMNRISSIVRVLEELRSRGVAVSVDDFGTGYSSLVHLKQLPLDKLKIDRSFVTNIENSRKDADFTEAIVALGRSIDLEVVAEGVETEGQAELLRQHGCNTLQGYKFSRPLSADTFFEWCRENR